MTKLLTIEYRRTLWSSLIVLMVAIVAYLFFISSSVFNTVALKDAEIKNTELRSDLANLEAQYVSLEQGINKETAAILGFIEVESQVFSYNSLGSTLSSR